MRLVCLTLLLLLLVPPPVDAAQWRVAKVGGRDYLPLSQVASFYRMRLVPRPGGVSLVAGGRRMDFRAGTREARVDGVKQWLSFPVVSGGEGLLLSRMDLAKTIDPLMRPHRVPGLAPFRTVVLDPGHGGHDRGAVNRLGYEKHYNLDICRRIRPFLTRMGLRVVITRSRDEFLTLEERARQANSIPGSIFVSIHCNAAPGNSTAATGFEVFSLTPRGAPNSDSDYVTALNMVAEPGHASDSLSLVLSTSIYHAMLGRVPLYDRGSKRARFAVLRRSRVPSVLVECGFMSSPLDARLLHTKAWRDRLAESIAMGILAYHRLAQRGDLPKLLSQYRREEAAVLAREGWEFNPLAGIGRLYTSRTAGGRGWRSLLVAPLQEELPSFRLEFEPAGLVQLEALVTGGEDARSLYTAPAQLPPAPVPSTVTWQVRRWPGAPDWRSLDGGLEDFPQVWAGVRRGPLADEDEGAGVVPRVVWKIWLWTPGWRGLLEGPGDFEWQWGPGVQSYGLEEAEVGR